MIRELFDLLIEGLHLLLLYGFLCICAIGVIIIAVSNADNNTPQSSHYVSYLRMNLLDIKIRLREI